MKASLRTSFAAFVFSSAVVGAAVPVFANGYYPGVDPHNAPGMQNRGPVVVPYYVDPAPTGSIYVAPVPRTILLSPSAAREHYTNEYHGGGQGDYYQGIIPPAPVP